MHRLTVLLLALTALLLPLMLASCGSSTTSTVSAAPAVEATAAPPNVAATATPAPTPVSAAVAQQRLIEGNNRYVSGDVICYNRGEDRPVPLNSSQAPFASILSCADSRVDPELAFNQPWGQLFICRVAGNIADPFARGSLEFGTAVLNARLIVVLGHENCGAVNAAVQGAQVGGDLQLIVDFIKPAADSVIGQPGVPLENATIANVKDGVRRLKNNPVIAQQIQQNGVQVVGALYRLQTGVVQWLP